MGNIMKIPKLLILLFCAVLITACNSDDEEDEFAVEFVDETLHFVWEGSVNGEWVVDASGDKVRFEIENGYMTFGNTTYENAWVDTGETADFSLNDEVIGAVQAVENVNNEQIVALVALDGTYLDIVGTEDNLSVEDTNIPAVLITETSSNPTSATSKAPASTAIHSLSSLSSKMNSAANTPQYSHRLPPPMSATNAYVKPSGERQMGILNRKLQ